jgi:hypothetical protein
MDIGYRDFGVGWVRQAVISCIFVLVSAVIWMLKSMMEINHHEEPELVNTALVTAERPAPTFVGGPAFPFLPHWYQSDSPPSLQHQ